MLSVKGYSIIPDMSSHLNPVLYPEIFESRLIPILFDPFFEFLQFRSKSLTARFDLDYSVSSSRLSQVERKSQKIKCPLSLSCLRIEPGQANTGGSLASLGTSRRLGGLMFFKTSFTGKSNISIAKRQLEFKATKVPPFSTNLFIFFAPLLVIPPTYWGGMVPRLCPLTMALVDWEGMMRTSKRSLSSPALTSASWMLVYGNSNCSKNQRVHPSSILAIQDL